MDIKPQPNYPFEFIQGDALTEGFDLYLTGEFDAIHASPPCQAYAWAVRRIKDANYPDLVPLTRGFLEMTKLPYVMENVQEAGLKNYVLLCGTMFGLKVIRHRHFEINWNFSALLPPCAHIGSVSRGDYYTVAGHGGNGRRDKKGKREAMGIDWMSDTEINQAIPPAYTQLLGSHLRQAVDNGYHSVHSA